MRSKLIVGLADEAAGNRVWDAVQHTTGASDALTVGGATLKVGFFGATPVVKPTGVTLGAGGVTALQTALANLGLIATTS